MLKNRVCEFWFLFSFLSYSIFSTGTANDFLSLRFFESHVSRSECNLNRFLPLLTMCLPFSDAGTKM